MKRFLAFYGNHYYPIGGMSDFIGSFDTVKEAVDNINFKHEKSGDTDDLGKYTWAHVWDSELDIQVFTID